MHDELSTEALQVISDEEQLLARVLATVQEARRTQRPRDTDRLMSQLRELREEAATATAKELPTIFADMGQIRALMEREDLAPLPDPATPYFAHLRLRTQDGSRDYLLGRATFANTAAGVRIVDWRYAPIAKIFYSYQEGDEYEEMLPGGMSEGVVEARRVLVVERGVLTRILAGPLVLVRSPDGAWRAEGGGTLAAGGAGSAARPGILGVGVARRGRADITSLLDAEQFEALASSGDRGLLVLGSAGSGKTTVALHRLSKLAFDDPNRYPPSRMSVIVPEEGLARLSRRLLEPLGLSKVTVETLEKWLHRTASSVFGAKGLKLCHEPPALVTRLKRHPALRAVIARRLGGKHARTPLPKLRRELAEVFTDRAFLTEVVLASGGDLPRTCIEETVRHTMLQIATPLSREFQGIDEDRLKTIDGWSLEHGTPDELAGTVDPEDLSVLLYLKAQGGGLQPERFAHLVLDEAEDFSLFELYVLGKHLTARRSVTLAGDEMQQTASSYAGWPEMLETMGVPDAAICRLQVSYRCPRPVVELAQHVLGPIAPPAPARPGREGAPVGFHHFPNEPQAFLFVAEALRDLVDREPDASIGVVASSEDVARELFAVLHDLPRTRLVLSGDFTFDPGIDVTDVENIKGLEFDYVVIPDATAGAFPATDEARRRLHVAVTRASHQLWVVSSGTRSPLLAKAPGVH